MIKCIPVISDSYLYILNFCSSFKKKILVFNRKKTITEKVDIFLASAAEQLRQCDMDIRLTFLKGSLLFLITCTSLLFVLTFSQTLNGYLCLVQFAHTETEHLLGTKIYLLLWQQSYVSLVWKCTC